MFDSVLGTYLELLRTAGLSPLRQHPGCAHASVKFAGVQAAFIPAAAFKACGAVLRQAHGCRPAARDAAATLSAIRRLR
jgi:hypothetical protein